jgi:pimeloyl-ACP methyl ester carboxylesterase
VSGVAVPPGIADPARIEKLLSVVRATRPLSDDNGDLYYSSNVTGHAQVFCQPGEGAMPEQLLVTDSRMVPHAHTPHGLLVRYDHDGDEIWQLGIVAGGALRPLTHDAKAVHRSVVLDTERKRAGLSWNPNGQADLVLGELDLATGALTPWTTPGGFWDWGAWSPDGSRAAVVRLAGVPSETYVLDRSGTMTRLLPRAVRTVPIAWTQAGIITLTDLDRDFIGLALVDPARPDEVARWMFAEDRELEGATVDPASTRAAIVVNEGVYDRIHILDLRDGAVETLALPPGVVMNDHTGGPEYHVTWAADGLRIFVSWEQPTRPAEIFEWPGDLRRTSTSSPPADLASPDEVEYASFDGLRIGALFYRVDGRPRPTVVQFHGGPEGQSRANFLPQAQLLNSIGVNLFLPNVRGSTGYGMRFQSLDDKTLRWNGVRDGCEAARFLKRTGAATRTAAMGGSYGGFMTLAVLVEDPDLWDAGVDVVGIADWHTFFANMPPWRGVLRMTEYGDPNGAEAEFLREISPIHRAASIRAPLLVIHGRNDPRVPVGESEQIARATGAELMIFEDEGHGIASVANQVRSNRRILEFLSEHLL